MRCPWCGSPVMVRGNWWECGYCGDSGAMPQPTAEQEVTLSVSLVCRVDLTETWNDLNTALQRLAPEHAAALKSLLGKTLFYEISDGVQQGNPPHDTQKMHELEAFLRDASDLCPEKTADTLMQEIERGMVYTILVRSYSGALCEIIGMTSAAIGLIRYGFREKTDDIP